MENSKVGKKFPFRKSQIFKKNKKIKEAKRLVGDTKFLASEESGRIETEPGEHTIQLKQCDIVQQVDIASASKRFHLDLNQYGPYKISYSLNGRHLLLGGRKGHIAGFNWNNKNLLCEVGVMESIYDVKWLHNETLFAVAQKDWTYIYDNQGIEVHCLKKFDKIMSLEFLPYHFLLVGGHETGYLSYVDVSIGKIVTQFRTKKGALNVMAQNPHNAIIHCGHRNGTVTLWSPTVRQPVASVLCHGSNVTAIAVDLEGRIMATGGIDGTLRLWDLRNSFNPLISVKVGAPTSLSFSQTGLLAAGVRNEALMFSKINQHEKPYLRHVLSNAVTDLEFCPFEDILGIGSHRGFDSILVPGAGEANFDALERNPFQTKKQRRESEVKSLLEKIPHELISLDNDVLTTIDKDAMKEEFDNKPSYVKKVDIKLKHGSQKGIASYKAKKKLQSELNLKQIRKAYQEEKAQSNQNVGIKARSGLKKGKQKADLADPLARFRKKTSKQVK